MERMGMAGRVEENPIMPRSRPNVEKNIINRRRKKKPGRATLPSLFDCASV
jgi:hypothetical protein